MSSTPPLRRPPPAASANTGAVTPIGNALERFAVTTGKLASAQRVMMFGPGGIGKTQLVSLAPEAIVVDLEDGSKNIECARVSDFETWAELRGWLQSETPTAYRTIVIDSITRAEELAVAHTLLTVMHPEKKCRVESIEGYGFGKGYQFVYDTFLPLLVDLDRHIRAGRNVVLIAHDCVNDVPNPVGDDWIRYEPRLQQPKSGKASIRERVFEWCDHVLFLGYDVSSDKGKGMGGGTRTIWPAERPSHRAKSRRISDPVQFRNATDGAIWPLILGGETK